MSDTENKLMVTNFQQMLLNDAGLGMEEVDKDSLTVPYIIILQAQSPVVAEAADRDDDSIRAGMFYNTSTQETFKEFDFLPCHFQRRYNLWWDDDGSFGGTYIPSDVETNNIPDGCVVKDKFSYIFSNNDGRSGKLVDTRVHFILYLSPETNTWNPAIISLYRTQVKHSKRLITMIKTVELNLGGKHITPPSWGIIYRANVIREKNDKGQWFAWNFTRVGPIEDADIYMRGRDLHESIVAGTLKAEPPASAVAENAASTEYDANTNTGAVNDDVPF